MRHSLRTPTYHRSEAGSVCVFVGVVIMVLGLVDISAYALSGFFVLGFGGVCVLFGLVILEIRRNTDELHHVRKPIHAMAIGAASPVDIDGDGAPEPPREDLTPQAIMARRKAGKEDTLTGLWLVLLVIVLVVVVLDIIGMGHLDFLNTLG